MKLINGEVKKFVSGVIRNKKFWISILIIVLAGFGGWLIYARYTQVMPQPTIYFLNDVVLPQQGQKVLVFSPHPDDETIGVGGYITQSVKNGAIVQIILVTNGNKHGLEEKRYDEFKKATSILGVPEENLIFLNYPDGKLQKENEDKLFEDFKSQIDEFNPNIIIYPNSQDQHPDHFTTAKVVEKILKERYQKIISYQYLIHHPCFPQPQKYDPSFFLLPPISMISFDKEWQRFMLPQEIEDQKNEAVLSYKSQLKTPFARRLLLAMIRQNELFSLDKTND